MNQAVEKFINWLEQETISINNIMSLDVGVKYGQYLMFQMGIKSKDAKDSIRNEIHNKVTKEYKENGMIEWDAMIHFFLDLFDGTIEKENGKTVFMHFNILCQLLNKGDFSKKEKLNIVLYLLEKNMGNLEEDAIIIDYDNISESEQEKENDSLAALKCIKRHYFDKQENLDETDILVTIKSMEVLGIEDILCIAFQKTLEKKLQRNEKENQSLSKPTIVKKIEYDYKSLEKEVSEAIDLKDMKPKRYLTLEEKIYYLSILTRMNVLKEERHLFLRNCEMISIESTPTMDYLENYNRLKYYEESVGLQKENSFMEECFKEMMLCSHEDYSFWRQSLEETLKQVEHWIPKNFEYEEKEASRLLSK